MGIITIINFKKMLLCYLGTKMYIFMVVILASSCSSTNSNEKLVKEFYDRAKQYESELPILFNVSYTARGSKNDKPLIPRIEVALNEKETVTLPGISEGMTNEEIKGMLFFENIEVYANKIGLPDSTAYQEVKNYSSDIVELAHKLEAYKVQSTSRLGKFIIFTLTQDDQVIYVPDVSEVDHEYWKEFFSSGKKLGENWYYRNTKSN